MFRVCSPNGGFKNTASGKAKKVTFSKSQKMEYVYIYIPSGPQVSARGGVGWGMLASCSCYVDATLMGGVGWGGAC